jgi:hypothetical protein
VKSAYWPLNRLVEKWAIHPVLNVPGSSPITVDHDRAAALMLIETVHSLDRIMTLSGMCGMQVRKGIP